MDEGTASFICLGQLLSQAATFGVQINEAVHLDTALFLRILAIFIIVHTVLQCTNISECKKSIMMFSIQSEALRCLCLSRQACQQFSDISVITIKIINT